VPRERNTKTHNIFCIDIEKVQSALLNNEDYTMDDVVESLVCQAVDYTEQALKKDISSNGFRVRLLFYGDEKYNSKLASFCKPFVQANQDVVTFRPKTASTVMLVWSENHVFAITTGQGFRIVQPFCVPKFGMQVVGVFENAFRITALDSNAMSSIVHSTKTIYSNEVDFIDVDNLDTIFKEVTGRLTDRETVQTLLRLSENSKKKSMKISARNYVQFSSSLNFDGLIHLLGILDQYDLTQLSDRFNLVVPLNVKHHEAIIEANNQAVVEKLYTSIQNGKGIEFDLFHRNTNEFVSADTYRISSINNDTLIEEDDIVAVDFIGKAYKYYLVEQDDSLDTFSRFIRDAKIESIKNDTIVTSDTLLQHISGEIQVYGNNYYMFYGNYYNINEDYSRRLNASLLGKLRQEYFINEITTEWLDDYIEDDFNHYVSVKEGYIHLHKTKPELIEFADLLKVEAGRATIIHVKDGFDGSMRELERQVELSIARMIDFQNNNQDSYIRRLYRKALTNTTGLNISSHFTTEQNFVDEMKSCSYRYIIVIHVSNPDLLASRSNIAKHCLNSLILKCFNRGVDLKINLV